MNTSEPQYMNGEARVGFFPEILLLLFVIIK